MLLRDGYCGVRLFHLCNTPVPFAVAHSCGGYMNASLIRLHLAKILGLGHGDPAHQALIAKPGTDTWLDPVERDAVGGHHRRQARIIAVIEQLEELLLC